MSISSLSHFLAHVSFFLIISLVILLIVAYPGVSQPEGLWDGAAHRVRGKEDTKGEQFLGELSSVSLGPGAPATVSTNPPSLCPQPV